MIHGFLPILEISLLLWAVLPTASQALPTPQIPARFFGVSGVNATFDYVVSRLGWKAKWSLIKGC